jgi:hypothetical protein
MNAVFKTIGKDSDGKYVRHAFISDKESGTEFPLCDRNNHTAIKDVSTKFISKSGAKVTSDKIGKDCPRCVAICSAMVKKSPNFTVVSEKVLEKR